MKTATTGIVFVLGICLAILLAACEDGGGAPTGATYSGVLATYPPGAELCETKGDLLGQTADGNLLIGAGASLTVGEGGELLVQCYGTKLTVGDEPVTLEGKTYEPGTKLTVDKDLHWIEVSSWD